MSELSPSLPQARALAASALGNYDIMPVSLELYADMCTPVQALRKLRAVSSRCYMLESVGGQENWGRYTFLGFDPSLGVSAHKGNVTITDTNGHVASYENGSPAEHIRSILARYRSMPAPHLPPFTGGFVGYFGYDYIGYVEETLNLDAPDTEGFKDVDVMLFDTVIAFDNYRQKIVLIANIGLDNIEENYAKASVHLHNLAQILQSGPQAAIPPATLKSPFREQFSREAFCDMVTKAQGHIHEGDIFQIVLSNRLDADFEGSLFDAYRVLRTTNPSPYMFYFSSDDLEIAGASPETLVKLHNGTLHTFPLAGSRPRGATPEEDAAYEADLLSDEKELAEHNMLVDLGRNDLGKISEFGSVEVERYMDVLKFSHIMHIGSTVTAHIREEYDAIDAIEAVLPAGTLSGAPKIRACEIINKLENARRGIYGGAIGYIDFSGNMDTCIAIRIAYKLGDKVYIRSGAGIVKDSIPDNEYTECINKAKAVRLALETAQGGVEK
ncbi:MAG: chorismate-binding protein [Actinomycetaceae bacterium]|nr:chorismate-binding protein [Actinomycetaceae bacterium]